MQQERDSFVLISQDEQTTGRIRQACEFLLLKPLFLKTVGELIHDDRVRPRTLIIDTDSVSEDQLPQLSKLRKMLPKTQVIGLVANTDASAKFNKHLNSFLTAYALQSFALEYFLFQRCYCEFYEMDPTDLFPETTVYFNAFHFLPLNEKYLPLVHENFNLSERKHRRIESLKALYLSSQDTFAYVQYIEKYFDQFKVGLRKRVKSRVYQMLTSWREMMSAALLEPVEVRSHSQQMPDFILWMNELLNLMVNAEDPWNIFYEMTRLPCFNFERSLMEVIAACYLSRNLGQDEAEQIIDLKFLLTLGRLQTDSMLHKRWILAQEFSPEEKDQWGDYPTLIKNQFFSADYPPGIASLVTQYQNQFLNKTEPATNTSILNYAYLGEVCVTLMQRSVADQYKKEDIVESIIVKCKSDGIVSEAWIEELRQFLKK